MRPHRLSFTAIGSYPGQVTVDFDALSPFGLFHIHGPTGAGKSSLLDAMCFALYGTVPSPRRADALRSHHAPPNVEAVASLEFAVQGCDWRVLRKPTQLRAKVRGAGSTEQRATAYLARRKGGGWLPVASGARDVDPIIHGLLGLDAAQFMQVVVLPQGGFQRVLRAGAEERSALLRTLFHSERFEDYAANLKVRADALDQRYQAQASRADHLWQQLRDLSQSLAVAEGGGPPGTSQPAEADPTTNWPEGLCEAALDIAHSTDVLAKKVASESLAAVAGAQQLVDRRDSEFREAHLRTSNWQRKVLAQNRLAALRLEASEIETARAELELAERLSPLGPLHERAEASAASLMSAQRARQTAQRALTVIRAQLPATEAELQKTLEILADGHPTSELVNAARKLVRERIAGIRSFVDKVRLVRESRCAAQSNEERARALEAETLSARENLAQCAEQLGHVEKSFVETSDLASRSEALLEETSKVRAQLANADEVFALRTRVESLREENLRLERMALDAERARLELLETRLQGMAGELASHLVDGSPCAVCGSNDHPKPALAEVLVRPDDLDAAANRAQQARLIAGRAARSLEDLRTRLTEVIPAAGQAANDSRPVELQLQRLEGELAASHAAAGRVPAIETAKNTLEENRSKLVSQIEQDESRFIALRSASEEAHRQAASIEAELLSSLGDIEPVSLSKALESLHDTLDALTGSMEEERHMTAQHESNYSALLAEARRLHIEDFKANSDRCSRPEEPRPAASESGARSLDAVSGAVAEADVSARRWTEGLLARALREALDSLRTESQMSVLRDRVQQWAEDERSALAVLREAAVMAVESAPDLAAAERASVEAKKHHAEAISRSTHLQSVAADITRLTERLDSQHATLMPLGLERERVVQLAELCRGGHVNKRRMSLERYVLAAFLEEVADAASTRLCSMSSGRYRLHHSDARVRGNAASGLSLMISDAYTGIEREVSTLSGGETFLASLALALGLSDVVQSKSGGVRIEALFIDEGFGSLDADTLDLAMCELDRLREGGRLVGVISHVSALRERIPAGIEVIPSSCGSTIHQSGVDTACEVVSESLVG